MQDERIKKFMALAGQITSSSLTILSENERKLGSQLLLSELLEYIIHGLGVTPVISGVRVTDPEAIKYEATAEPDYLEMVDGLADVAYTMYWNSCAFGIPLEKAFDLVCDNNLEKFVKLPNWTEEAGALQKAHWDCGLGVSWPKEVVRVEVLRIGNEFFAVGKDERNKVRKPSTYKSVDLSGLVVVDQGLRSSLEK